MTFKNAYAQAMEWLYMACIALSGTALVVITLIIPYGVFMRYVMNNPQSWPEPASVVMMVFFSFVGGVFDLPHMLSLRNRVFQPSVLVALLAVREVAMTRFGWRSRIEGSIYKSCVP